MREAIIVLPGSGTTCGAETDGGGGGFLGDPGCDSSSGGSSVGDTTSGGSGSTAASADESSSAPQEAPKTEPSCGCTNESPRATWLLVPLLALATRGRATRSRSAR
jgi:hypothetical protein